MTSKDKENEAKEVVVIAENEKLEEDKENMVVMEPHQMVLDEVSDYYILMYRYIVCFLKKLLWKII